jgi:hypothetical protein
MSDPNLLPAVQTTIRQNEIGDSSPYCLSFACLGQSGASFGYMQGDTNVSALTRATLRYVLSQANTDQTTSNRILSALSRALPNGNPLTKPDTLTVNKALAGEAGQKLVDQMDAKLLKVVLDGLDLCTSAAATNHLSISPIAYLYFAPWINMSGTPTLLTSWLKGAPVNGVPAPTLPTVLERDAQAYLQSMAYFQAHPRNFAHLEECVEKGAAELPPAQA